MIFVLVIIIIALVIYSVVLMKKVNKVEVSTKSKRNKTQVNQRIVIPDQENEIDQTLIDPDELYATLPINEQIVFLSEQHCGYVLEIIKGSSRGKILDLIGMEILIGRSTNSDLTINDSMISESHAKINVISKDKFEIEDLLSTNGTFLNGNQIEKNELKENDTIVIGDSELKFKKEAV